MFRIVILIVALGAGGIAAWMAMSMRSEPSVVTVVQAPPKEATREVLVVNADVAQGQVVTKENLRWQAWPESAFNAAFITRETRPGAIETLAGKAARKDMLAGEPLREDKLAPPSAGGLSAMMPRGKRAVAVRISAETTAGGFILPNDRVDVLQTVSSPNKTDGPRDATTHTILTNIMVLAIDQSLDEKSKDDKTKAKLAAIGKTATLEVDRAQAEIVVAAEAAGALSLALRSAADNSDTTLPQVYERAQVVNTVFVIHGGLASAPNAVAPPKTP